VRLGVLHGTGAGREGGEVQRGRPVVVPRASRPQRDLVAMAQELFAADTFAVYVSPVQAAKITQQELSFTQLDDAVLLRHDLVEELDRVVRMPAEAVRRAKVDRLRPLGGGEDQSCHKSGREPN